VPGQAIEPKLVALEGSLKDDQGLPLLEDGESLTFELEGLELLQKRATKANPITLFLADAPVKGCSYQLVPENPHRLRFDLAWTEEARPTWTRVFGRWGSRPDTVTAAVGLADGSLMAWSDDVRVGARVFRLRLRWALILIVLAVTAVMGSRARIDRLLRVSSRDSQTKLPFSLGRTQMAWWFANILVAYLLIWGTVGAIDTITAQMLVLMGLGASTALGATMIDASKVARAEEAAGAAKQAALAAPGDADKQAASSKAQLELDRLRVDTMPASHGFLADILTDSEGYSLHRFQMVIWTLVVTTIFWYSVWRDLAMPQLGDTLLALMGISAGTYLGFKIPEK
jgi:hypothetical protein